MEAYLYISKKPEAICRILGERYSIFEERCFHLEYALRGRITRGSGTTRNVSVVLKYSPCSGIPINELRNLLKKWNASFSEMDGLSTLLTGPKMALASAEATVGTERSPVNDQ